MPNLTFAVAKKRITIIPAISVGQGHSLASKFSNRTWAWGLNSFGQLGNRSIANTNSPVSVCGAVKTFCRISAGAIHSLSIDKNGRAWAWGQGSAGELGDNSNTPKSTPVSILGAVKTFCQIAAGSQYSLAIDKNGRVWAWGIGTSGVLGDNTITSKITPVSILGAVKTFCQISAGVTHSVSIDKNGRAWAWGSNLQGRLGDNSVTSRLTPVSVAGTVRTFCRISAGFDITATIDKNGRAWTWGQNTSGQLGQNSATARSTPLSVAGAVKTFCKISAGYQATYAIDKNGRAWAWGANVSGQLGDNSITNRSTPVSVAGAAKTFCEITQGKTATNNPSIQSTLAVDKNGKIWVWGVNNFGQLGLGYSTNTPLSILGQNKTFCKISHQRDTTLAIDRNGLVWAWGSNPSATIGNNSIVSSFTPVSVCGAVKTFCQISAGVSHSVSIDKNGRAWAWGSNLQGRLGDNSVTSRSTPVSVAGTVRTFCQISAGASQSVAIDKNGRAWAWGSGASGALGDNTTTSKSTPVSVAGAVRTFCQISTGTNIGLAIDKNGRAWGWGVNNGGQLGDNSITNRSTPVSVAGAVKTFCQISTGSNIVSAIDKNGRAWGWGFQSITGAIGDNSTANRSTPVSVAGAVKTFCKISSGYMQTLAIDKNGRAWAWGTNTYGNLGIGYNVNNQILTPISVAGAVKTFCEIFADRNLTAVFNQSSSVAIDKNGRVWVWGDNKFGQLARNHALVTPIQISNF